MFYEKRANLCGLFLFVSVLLGATASCFVSAQENEAEFALVEIEVLDDQGQPLADVTIDVAMDNLEFPIPVDDQGYGSLNLPEGSSLDLKFHQDGYVPQHVHWSRGSTIPNELKVVMQQGLPLGGTVRDKQGQPIEGVEINAKTLTKGFRGGTLQPSIQGVIAKTDHQGRWQAKVGTKELMDLVMTIGHSDYVGPRQFRVSRAAYQEMRALKYTTVLPKRHAPTGTVVDSQGQPVPGAQLFVALASRRIQLLNGKTENFIDTKSFESIAAEPATATDDDGQFVLPIQEPGFVLVCVDDLGWAEVSGSKWDANRPVEIKLTPWVQLEGSVQLGGKAVAGEEVAMYFLSDFQRERLDLERRYLTRTDEQGKFVFDRVTPGAASVFRRVNGGDGSYINNLASHGVDVSVAVGEKSKVELGGTGRAVVGKSVLHNDGKPGEQVYGQVTLMKIDVVGSLLKNALFAWGQSVSAASTWPPRGTSDSRVPSSLGTYAVGLQADGSFRIEDVPPGQYRMETIFFGPPEKGRVGKRLGVIVGNHLVPEAKQGETEPVDLGESAITASKPVVAPPAVAQ